MPEYTGRGQRASERAASRHKLRTKAGQGRISHSLGADDPRHRRNDQAAQATERQFHPDFFYVDQNGRLRPRT